MENAVIIFLKYPEPGKVKTRLAKDIGNEKACAIYKLLAENVIKNILTKNPGTYDVHIFFTPADKENEIKNWLKSIIDNERAFHIQYSPQKGNTLGERMSNAFQQTLQRKDCKRCIIIGTDCPEIDATMIESVFEILKEKDIVIGPCKDGGYYLLGMSGPVPVSFKQGFVPELFEDIDWSTDRVFIQTMEKIQKNNLSCGILKTLVDIDTIEDLYQYASDIL
ncbi:MAG: TIGR04282 family arsenosugar biosynthesis glycosyltransferase [Planctomycetes bacterium]|uniref:TIGR04282 family arsenosugar biosynthesis glycosyltransferase n=1 Tax=Candidatus Wunengus californicus TaxID=3367619 RepID=UPI0040257AA2|nr:TIGR04282 family arsenosugar biosynthesis glycosyltransferase [Planctomycetota bacterium]